METAKAMQSVVFLPQLQLSVPCEHGMGRKNLIKENDIKCLMNWVHRAILHQGKDLLSTSWASEQFSKSLVVDSNNFLSLLKNSAQTL